MNIDLSGVVVAPLDDGDDQFRESLSEILERIAPLAASSYGLAPADHVRRLNQAINATLETLEELTGITNPDLLPALIERVSALTVTGDDIEVQMGIAGDLRVTKQRRLSVDEVLASIGRSPVPARPSALRDAVTTLRRLLALLLLHGWVDNLPDETDLRQEARRAIVDTVQGQLYAGIPAL